MNECQRKTFNYLKRVYTSDCQVDVGARGTKWDVGSLKRLAGGLFDLTGSILMGPVDVSSLRRRLKSNKLLLICRGRRGNLMRGNYTSHLSSFLGGKKKGKKVLKIIILQFAGRLQLWKSALEYEPLWRGAGVFGSVLYRLQLAVDQLSPIRGGAVCRPAGLWGRRGNIPPVLGTNQAVCSCPISESK